MSLAARINLLLGLILLLTAPARSAVVNLGGLDTDTSAGQPAGPLSSSTTFTVDLNDRTGLTPGQPILITLTSTADTLWTGSFKFNGGPAAIDVDAKLELTAGGQSVFASVNVWDFSGTPEASGPDTTAIVGYSKGPRFDTIGIFVPWETDLSTVTITLSQNALLTGGQFLASRVHTEAEAGAASAMQLRLQSVPEPGSALLLLTGAGLLTARRRR